MRKFRVIVLLGIIASPAMASPSIGAAPITTIAYQPPERWVRDVPLVKVATVAPDAPLQIAYIDTQVNIAPDGAEAVYTAYRVKILKPEALSAGNISVAWQPEDGPMVVHSVRLVHDGHIIDVLASTKFTVLQRELQLEQSMLTGQRTAILQVPGLQVGDELVVAITIHRLQSAFGGKVGNFMQMPVLGTPGEFRFRLLWPDGRKIVVRGTNDLPALKTVNLNGQNSVELTMFEPKGAVPTEGAPPRYNVRRLIEYSDFGSWPDVSRLMNPLFERATKIAPDSPIRAEAAAIAARTNDPTERAQAALQVVQDRIRYVFVGLNGGNYTPTGADTTWQRRFGDCKAKTVLLVALLRELGIDAAPALVNSTGGDGIDQRLRGPHLFDHVIVRAVIAGKTRWLDGTRIGDSSLTNVPSPFRWALPLTVAGSELEKIAPSDVAFPMLTGIVDIDATAGVDRDARVSMQNIIRGDEAFAIRSRLAGLAADDADRALKSYWRQQVEWATPDKVTWSYDQKGMALVLGLVGRGNPGWTGDATKGHSLAIPGAGFYKPDPMRRPADQDQSANWAVTFPRFRCWATTIRLPKAVRTLNWSLYAGPVNQRLAGIAYWRASGFNGNVVRTVMSSHSYAPEASPDEAAALNRAIPRFNNNISTVEEVTAAAIVKSSANLPFADDVDWLNAPTPCTAQ